MFTIPAVLATVVLTSVSAFTGPSRPDLLSRQKPQSQQLQQYQAAEASFERRLVALFATAGEEEDVEVLRSRAAELRAEVDAMQVSEEAVLQ
jgi:hypothetical protein